MHRCRAKGHLSIRAKRREKKTGDTGREEEEEEETRRLRGVEDEEKWLAEGIAGIQHNAFFMHRALDANNLREVLKYSALMLSELRTSKLSPQKYYDLYMRAFDQLRQLEIFLRDESRHGLPVVDLYELVQHAGNILPRMYLLCTVGSVYIKSKQAPSKDVLKDLVEMCRGVQHPIRGLFLRSYLTQVSRDKLPEIGSDYQGDANTVMDAVEDLEQFERSRRKRGTNFVGKNLHVLGQIEGVHLEMYKETVLPRILEQVVNCKDDFAQYYLMECIIQVFPDEYHLQTLETLLAACTQLMPTVDTKIVLTQLMDRLSNYAVSSPDVLHEFLQVEAFAKLNNAIGKVIDTQIEMPIVGAMTLVVSLLTFALRVHPDRLDYVDQVLVEVLVELIKGLIKDLDGNAYRGEDFQEEQNSVARLINMLDNEEPEEMLKIICVARKHLMTGGTRRLPFTIPPLIFSALRLVRQLESQGGDMTGEDLPATPRKIFQILNQTIEVLSSVPCPELALRLYLQCAEAASDCDLEPAAYEFFTQAFILYEEEIADSKAQVTAIHLIAGTLQRVNVFSVENRDTLTPKATGGGYSARLLKKPDQCRAVYACSHLFWVDDLDGIKDGERRALRIANAAQQMANATRGSSGSVTLYIYFYEKGNPHITPSDIQSLIELINTEMQSDNNGNTRTHSDPFFTSTLRYMRFQKQKGGLMGDKYELIKL
ncbi:hypothetical protein Bca101_049596 [Brassica carinata]